MAEDAILGRRGFLAVAGAASLLTLLTGCRDQIHAQKGSADVLEGIRANAITDTGVSWCGARDVPANVSSTALIAPSGEKGERIRVSGTVFQADGNRPAPSVLIYLYHTDIYGIYGREGEHRHGRYRGWLLTDVHGRYVFESIRPASYPNTTIAAHIHMTVTTETAKEDWVDSILFEGDRFITARERNITKGGFDPVLKFEKNANGVFTAERNIRLV